MGDGVCYIDEQGRLQGFPHQPGGQQQTYIHRKCLASSLVPHYIVISTRNLNECFPVSLPKGKSQCECCLPTIIPVSL